MPLANISASAILDAFTAMPLPWKSPLKIQWAVPIQGESCWNVIKPPSSPSPVMAHVFCVSQVWLANAMNAPSVCGPKSSLTFALKLSHHFQTRGKASKGNGLVTAISTSAYRQEPGFRLITGRSIRPRWTCA